MSLRPLSGVVKWRAALALLSVVFLCLYRSQVTWSREVLERYSSQLNACQQNADSLLGQLQMTSEHKRRVESALHSISEEGKTGRERLEKCEETRRSAMLKAEQCATDLHNQQVKAEKEKEEQQAGVKEEEKEKNGREKRDKDEEKEKEEVEKLKRELERLELQVSDLQASIKAKTEQLNLAETAASKLQAELASCDEKIAQHVGAPPKKYYVQNETVHFERSHKAGEALNFNRDEIQFAPAPIMPAAELVEKLRRRKEQAKEAEEVHPEDRKEEDDYVNEQPDRDEKDYKEGM